MSLLLAKRSNSYSWASGSKHGLLSSCPAHSRSPGSQEHSKVPWGAFHDLYACSAVLSQTKPTIFLGKRHNCSSNNAIRPIIPFKTLRKGPSSKKNWLMTISKPNVAKSARRQKIDVFVWKNVLTIASNFAQGPFLPIFAFLFCAEAMLIV